jgi:hypothetical protein
MSPLLHVEFAGLAGGIVLLFVTSLVARRRDDDPARGRHLAAASSTALAALPVAAAALLGLAPDPRWWLTTLIVVLAVTLVRGAWVRGPGAGLIRQLGVVLLVLVSASAAVVSLAGILAHLGSDVPPVTQQRADAIYEMDARVVTRKLPQCRPAIRDAEMLLDRGAHPRLDAEGRFLWFDSRIDNGTRQVHRFERASGAIVCWTCDEPGNNRRPAPGGTGASVVFDSDRHANWRAPANTELYLASARGEQRRGYSRRLTFAPGPDDHPLMSPGSGVLVWSRGREGRYDVVSASLHSGHGGVLLGSPGTLATGGSAWAIPLAWSIDARSLVVATGQPFRPLHAVLIDPATDRDRDLGKGVPSGSTAAFNADGGWMILARTEPVGIAALLPETMGFLLARLATTPPEPGRRTGGTRLDAGEPWAAATGIELGTLADWGEPTGVALEPDGRGFVVGQRRRTAEGSEERLVAVTLDCDD